MSKEDRIAGKQTAAPVAQINEHQVSPLVPLDVAVGILELIEHAPSNHRDEVAAPNLGVTHNCSGPEVIEGGDFAGRKRSTVYPGVTAEGVVEGLTILT